MKKIIACAAASLVVGCSGGAPDEVGTDEGATSSLPVVIGHRRADAQTREAFDDTFEVHANGKVVFVEGSTHPFVSRSPAVAAVGMIRPGRYLAVARDSWGDIGGQKTFHVLRENGREGIPGWRDTDHDGVYSDEERAASEAKGDVMTAILFHVAGEPGTPDAIGCQVFSADQMKKLLAALGGAKKFTYVLQYDN